MEAVRLRIADKYFFDNAELLLPSIKDAAGGLLEDGVNAWLTQIYNLTPKTHKDRGVARSGYDAKELNGALREKMNVISGIHKETCVDCGALLSKGKEGFDFYKKGCCTGFLPCATAPFCRKFLFEPTRRSSKHVFESVPL